MPLADVPFLVAYSQKAMLDLVLDGAPLFQASLWALAYAAIGFLLWALSSRISPPRGSAWRTVLLGWLGAEMALVFLAWALGHAGVLRME
jgi:hypothetical protein